MEMRIDIARLASEHRAEIVFRWVKAGCRSVERSPMDPGGGVVWVDSDRPTQFLQRGIAIANLFE